MTVAKYMAATQACKEAIWLKRLLEKLRHTQKAILLYYDNQSAFYIAKNPAFHLITKYIGVQYHFVCEIVEGGSMDMHKIHNKENLTDILTKPVNVSKFVWYKFSFEPIKG